MGLTSFQVELSTDIVKSLLVGNARNFSVLHVPRDVEDEDSEEFVKLEHGQRRWEIYIYGDGAEFNYALDGIKFENRLDKDDFQGDLVTLSQSLINEIDQYCRRAVTEPVAFPRL